MVAEKKVPSRRKANARKTCEQWPFVSAWSVPRCKWEKKKQHRTKKKKKHTHTNWISRKSKWRKSCGFLFIFSPNSNAWSGNDEQRCKISVENIAMAKNIIQNIMPKNTKYLEKDSNKKHERTQPDWTIERSKNKIGRKLSKLNLAYDTYFLLSYSHELLWSDGCFCITHARRYSNWRLGVLSTANIIHNYFLIAYSSKLKAIDWMLVDGKEGKSARARGTKAENTNESVAKSVCEQKEEKIEEKKNGIVYSFSTALILFCFICAGQNHFKGNPKLECKIWYR